VGVVERIFNKKTFLLAGLVAAIALPVGQYLLRDAEAAIPPTMTSVSPNSGPTSGGTQVEITGDNFMTDSTWKQIASGRDHTCAIASDDQAYCWGDNNYGQLGNGDMSLNHSLAPIAVQSSDPGDVLYGKTIKQISAGYYYTCAIASDDQAYCWGDGWSGQLGNDLIGDTPVPVAVDTSGVLSGKTIKQIAPSESHTCAIASDDQAYCWGRGHTGQLGDDLGSNSLVPVAVKNSDPGDVLYGKTIKQIVTGEMHTCAIASDDQAYCWGYGEEGQLGDDYASAGRSDVPVAVDTSGVLNGKTIKQISSGYYHICVIASDDQAYCWGGNWNGVLGNGDDLINYASVPLPVQNSNPGDALYGKTIEQVAAGQSHTCVIASDGQAYCWGMNWFNQLGTDTGYSYISYDPLPVQNSDPGDALYGKVLKQMSAGYQHTCAIASDDQAYCWGDNSHGQLGDGKIGGDGQPMGHGPAAPVIVKSNPSALYGRSVKQVSIGRITSAPSLATTKPTAGAIITLASLAMAMNWSTTLSFRLLSKIPTRAMHSMARSSSRLRLVNLIPVPSPVTTKLTAGETIATANLVTTMIQVATFSPRSPFKIPTLVTLCMARPSSKSPLVHNTPVPLPVIIKFTAGVVVGTANLVPATRLILLFQWPSTPLAF